jgi:hypothetical protein
MFKTKKMLQNRIDAVKRLHSPTMYFQCCGYEEDNEDYENCCEPYEICAFCDEVYPCLTIEALGSGQ